MRRRARFLRVAIGLSCDEFPEVIRYPLYTALLSDSRWIGNPINHSTTTVSVSPSCLSAFFHPYPIQRIQLAEVGWESHDKGFERKRGWVVCIKSCATVSVLV